MSDKIKDCFIIMPISDHPDYPKNHWSIVYEYLIKPAVELAGFQAVRADDVLMTNHIAIDIVKKILRCDMAVCDLSSKNPNVLYELGIRQAFNLPVTILKDIRTERIFDIQMFRDVEYNESLRPDSLKEAISELSETIKNTYHKKDEINSLISLLGIEPAKISEKTKISVDTELIMNAIAALEKKFIEVNRERMVTTSKTERASSSDKELLNSKEISELKLGDRIDHPTLGQGKIIGFKGTNVNKIIEVDFDEGGRKLIMMKFAKLYKIS